ncbi:MAG: hypothetical protein E7Z67_03570 [Thermoplasmata archaeon]|nr:hypothetical protein [Thermoplasmata archaeon]
MDFNEKLAVIKKLSKERKIRIMIIGLGSVGNYLLDYLASSNDEEIEVIVVGRNEAKMVSDVNIVRVAALIRGRIKNRVTVVSDVDLNDVDSITDCLKEYDPDIIVNSSRAYAGLKYGSISWKNIRAYGVWSPLSIKYIRNIMVAYDDAGSHAIVINTSYSDAVNAWIKSAGFTAPDLGSGNINHLIPRIKYSISEICGIEDYWNIDLTYATSHFHDVVISKEGQDEGVEQMFVATYGGKVLDLDKADVLSRCSISMPTDAKRNMMNASSNFEIIRAILSAIRDGSKVKLHCPGPFGEIGGYPVIIDGSGNDPVGYIDESVFSLDEMRSKNRSSIYLDGIEDVRGGSLVYTDELLEKVRSAFGTDLPKEVPFEDIDIVAGQIVSEIIEKYRGA